MTKQEWLDRLATFETWSEALDAIVDAALAGDRPDGVIYRVEWEEARAKYQSTARNAQ